DLNQEIIHVRSLLSRTIPKAIKIYLKLSDDLAPIQADRSQVAQVLMNLAINAKDAMPIGGTLTIETSNIKLDEAYCKRHLGSNPGRYVILTVSDNGCGMDGETLTHMYEPFFSTKEEGKGTGLGLATIYGIIKNHNGHITCDSELGHGTIFKIYFPAI
ncbi:MAG: two-component system sensor histidine kinase NtrB, partial [Desulfomonilaceae bacterium]